MDRREFLSVAVAAILFKGKRISSAEHRTTGGVEAFGGATDTVTTRSPQRYGDCVRWDAAEQAWQKFDPTIQAWKRM